MDPAVTGLGSWDIVVGKYQGHCTDFWKCEILGVFEEDSL